MIPDQRDTQYDQNHCGHRPRSRRLTGEELAPPAKQRGGFGFVFCQFVFNRDGTCLQAADNPSVERLLFHKPR